MTETQAQPTDQIRKAVLFLAGRCDGAVTQDGQGFNKWDTDWGHRAADQIASGRDINPVYALKVVTKYRKQLQRAGLELPAIEVILAEAEKRRKEREAQEPSGVQISKVGATLNIQFPYDQAKVEKARTLPGRRWNPGARAWTCPATSLDAALNAFPEAQLMGSLAAEVEAKRKAEEEARKKRQAEFEEALARFEAFKPAGLFAHQESGVPWLIERKKAILADDMGLGKTRQALLAAKAFGCRIIVVAPMGLRVDPWLREAEFCKVQIEVFSWAKAPAPPQGDFVLIADEAHYAQSLKAQRTQKFLALAKAAKAVFCLTGTPIKNGRPANIFPLLVGIQHELAANRRAFEIRYCNAGPTRWSPWDATGAANLEELHEKLSDCILRRMKTECLDLPEKTRVMRKAELSEFAQARYNKVFQELQASYHERKAKGEIGEADAIVLLNHLRHAGSVAKTEAAIEMAEEVIEQGGQVVLFVAFLDSAKQLADTLGAGRITGEESQVQRQQAIDAFRAGQLKAMVCTLGAGNVGISLHTAQTVILVDRPWTPGDAVQAEDRLHRIGQKGSVLAIWLQTNGADQIIDALLQDKHEKIELILGGKKKSLFPPKSVIEAVEAIFG